ncbi:MAG: histone deacetylase [Acidobacteria bacterium RIFCSPLOWO2_12_FULL_54_10]|nr:MAG: histone deacetylase [Acidobacteria bacterium RIFCSPLOWO2_12_FULL_54_10]
MTGFVYDEIYLRHLAGDTGHPDRPERLTAVQDGLKSKGLLKLLLPIQARKVSDDVLELVHDKDYLALLRREAVDIAGLRMLSTGDTVISPDSLEAAYWAAGGVLSAVDAVMKGEVGNAFAAVRPPGHHATRNRGMGFCIFNNVAVAARYLQQAHGIARVLIVDWDYHHGNGTQDIFYDDPSIFYFSTHDTSAYPGTGSSNETGSGPGAGATLNIPLPRGASDELILEAFQQHLVPAARIFKPDFILISAGFDAMRNDLLGEFDVTPAGFAALTRVVHDLAVELSHGRLVSVLEGGYRLDGLAASVAAHVEVLMEPATSAQSH